MQIALPQRARVIQRRSNEWTGSPFWAANMIRIGAPFANESVRSKGVARYLTLRSKISSSAGGGSSYLDVKYRA